MLGKSLITAAAGNAGVLGVEDAFSTWLYTGNGSTQTITNGIDLAGEGGLVWLKSRSAATDHQFFDTARGATEELISNSSAAEATDADTLTAFNANGFDLGADSNVNTNGATYASWTFRKAEKFFDVVTYTGTGSNRTVAHSLGSVPGFIVVKRVNSSGAWVCQHRSLGATQSLFLNGADAAGPVPTHWSNTNPTSTEFTLGTDVNVNGSGDTYVAYLFAHDAGGFGGGGGESAIKCGTFTCDGSGNVGTVSLGWEPQWILAKRIDTTQNWLIWDTMRGWNLTNQPWLSPNLSSVEFNPGASYFAPTATGFSGTGSLFGANAQVVYIAIRRGPMKTPKDATTVFNIASRTDTYPDFGFPADLFYILNVNGGANYPWVADRLRGPKRLVFSNINAETAEPSFSSPSMDGNNNTYGSNWGNSIYVPYGFRRAPGFFDVVAYTGTGVVRTVPHNLGVVPELMIVKNRSASISWAVYHQATGATSRGLLNSNFSFSNASYWDNTSPASTVFTVEADAVGFVNTSGSNYIAYLFATCPGVSKVGSYTGTGTTLQIDCGFASGARFVLIKRTDSIGDWYVWDTVRGIVSGNDPYLLINSTAAEVTGTDYIDPYSAGFEISSTAPATINASGGSYIFLAIA